MTREEQLMKFWHETYLRPRSMALHLFPAKPAGFVRATQDLGNFASNASVARKARLEGKIQTASEYERIADGIYNRLPSYAKDVADAIDGGEIPSLPGKKSRSNPVRTTRWLARQSERFYDARANKAVSEAIRLSRKTGTYDRLVAAYRANDPEAVAGILTFTRAVSDAFEGGGGYNLVRANAVSYVRAHMDRIGSLLAKAPQKPRSAVRSNPRGAIKPYSVWALRRRSFPGEETRVYVTQVTNGHVFFAKYFSDARGNMPEESFRRQYKPAYKSKE